MPNQYKEVIFTSLQTQHHLIMFLFSSLAFIPSVGPGEWVAIIIVLLLLFGAKKLPELARGMGKSLGEFKKAKDEFEHEITRGEDEVTHTPKTSATKKSQSHDTDDA